MDLSYMGLVVDVFSPAVLGVTLVCTLLAVKIIFIDGKD